MLPMRRKVILILISFIFTVTFYASAQLKTVYEFKDVNITLNLKHEDKILKKGSYNLEVAKNQGAGFFVLRIKKKRKVLCVLTAEYLRYDSKAALSNPNIPDEPTMQLKKNAGEKELHIIFESGKRTTTYPFIKLRFKIGYED